MPHKSTLAADPDIGPILPHYIARLPAQVATLRRLAAAGDAQELQKRLHQLRGSGKSYGFATLSDLAAKTEETLAAGKSAVDVQSILNQLIDYIEHIEGYPR